MGYKTPKFSRTALNVNKSVEGETIEQKFERIMSNGEKIGDGAPIIHTERKDGVMAQYNPRTDKFEMAIDATDKNVRAKIAKRDEATKEPEMKLEKGGQNPQNNGGTESIQGKV